MHRSDSPCPPGYRVRVSHFLPRVSRKGTAVAAAALLAACITPGSPRPEPRPSRTFAHAAEYRVSCSVRNECRIQYLDEDGELTGARVVGEWTLALGADDGTRLWLRAGAGGCPPSPVRVEILIDGRVEAERVTRSPGGSRCDWILAETEVRIPLASGAQR